MESKLRDNPQSVGPTPIGSLCKPSFLRGKNTPRSHNIGKSAHVVIADVMKDARKVGILATLYFIDERGGFPITRASGGISKEGK